MSARRVCYWCGRFLESEAVAWALITDPVTGNEIVLIACSEEHLRSLRSGTNSETPEHP